MQHNFFRHWLRNFTLICLIAPPLWATEFPGGFIEQPGTGGLRPPLSQSQILDLLPQRGAFSFPAPYNTIGVRLTNTNDCAGQDCVNYVGYSYWRNINNHVGQDVMLILVGMDRSRGGAGPSLISFDKSTDEVINLGPLFDSSNSLSWATGEGWYFSAGNPYSLYINSGAKLLRYDVVARQFETVFDATNFMGDGFYIWQTHTSNDDRVHSATLRDAGNYEMLGCLVYLENTARFQYFPKEGDFDECQVDKSGKWLVIKENVDHKDGEDNRIVDLDSGQERIILDREGAGGHSDLGYGYMIAADNWANDANTLKLWKFDANVLQGVTVYHNTDWNISAPEHVSHANSVVDVPPEQQIACGSSANRSDVAEANEVICFGLGQSDEALIVAPVMTNLDANGGGDDYGKAPKGNFDVTGKYFIWTSNMGGSRLDAFLVKVPGELLSSTSGVPDPGTDPGVPPPDPLPAVVVWSNLVNAVVNANVLSKSGGCDGCPDAGAVSQQEISSGDGYFEFTAAETQKLRYVGLSVNQQGTGAGDIDFALAPQAGYVEVRENGVYRADTPISSGDVLRISVQAGAVSYARNGTTFYTSSAGPTYPLRSYATLFASGSSVSNAQLAPGSTPPTPPPPASPPPTALLPAAVAWSNLVHAVVKGTVLSKSGGCNGCADSHANSSQQINSGDGYLEFTVNETRKLRYVGLSVKQSNTAAAQIDHALAVQAGYVEVRENGVYRTDMRVRKGDVLRISVEGGKVNYTRNGTLFYTSGASPVYPLRVYATLFSRRSTISNAIVAKEN